METWDQRLRARMTERNLKQADIKRAVKVSNYTVSAWVHGEHSPQGDNLVRLCHFLEVRPEWLVSGKEPKEQPGRHGHTDIATAGSGTVGERPVFWESKDDLDPSKSVFVPRLDAKISAGNGKLIYEAPNDGGLSFQLDWIQKRGWSPDKLICLEADGDSMEPTIGDGAMLLVNLAETEPKDGKVYVLRFGSNVRVKRLYARPDGGLTVHSDNPSYKPIEVPIDQMEHVAIIGRVVWQAGIL